MKVESLRNYGVAFSDAEGSWSPQVRKQMKRASMGVVFSHLGLWQRARFLWRFARERRRTHRLDLSAIRERGVTNERFLEQQLDYLAFFAALVWLLDEDRAVEISKEVMDATREALLLCLPELDDMAAFDDPMDALRQYLRAMTAACNRVGCQEMDVVEDDDDRFGFDVHWCVWLELARLSGQPRACEPNCHADDLVFPDYFDALGITYERTDTLGCGGCRCDFRFRRR